MRHPFFKDYEILDGPVNIGDLVTLIPESKFFTHPEAKHFEYERNPGWGLGVVKSYSEHSAFNVTWTMGSDGEELHFNNNCYQGGSCIKKVVKCAPQINYKQKQIQIL